jgi:hypothetical protein
MLNTCVMCGDPTELPEGTQVCFACSHAGINCPDCGAPLNFMSSCRSYTDKQVLYLRLYHCGKCHADWEAESQANERPTELKRKFWG